MRTHNSRSAWVGAIMALALVASWAATATAQSPSSVTLEVEGMHCGSCAERLEDVLGRLDGVISADVSFDQRRAVVRYDARRVDVARIIRAVEDAGFSARREAPRAR